MLMSNKVYKKKKVFNKSQFIFKNTINLRQILSNKIKIFAKMTHINSKQ